jgi:hypothetical protein
MVRAALAFAVALGVVLWLFHSAESVGFTASVPILFFGVILAMLAPMWVLGQHKLKLLRGWNHENQVALVFTREGELERAIEIFERLVKGATRERLKAPANVYRLNLAVARMENGELDGALAAFRELDGARGLKGRVVVAHLVALCSAWMGDADAAHYYLRMLKPPNISPIARCKDLQLEALVAARREGPAASLATLDAGWSSAEAGLSGNEMAKLHLLRALALDAHGGEASEVDQELAAARRVPRAFLGAARQHWPELDAFLTAHKVATA